MLIILFILLSTSTITTYQQQQQQLYHQINRIECKSEPERDSTYYTLNCTLINKNEFDNNNNIQSQQTQLQSPSSSSSSLLFISQTSIEITSSDGIKVGLTSNWKTPWEQIQLNYDIIKTFIWKSSRLSYIGEFTFQDLNNLETIDLSSNRIYEINPNSFKNFENNLIEFDLSGNLFETIPTYLFQIKVIQSIETFKFNDNKIYKLNNRTFDYLTKLKHLELNNCFIKEIDINTFFNLKSLEYLSLNGNHLKTLNEATFKDLNLRYLYLNENLFVCDCNLRWLLSYLKTLDMYKHNILIQSTITLKCSEPNSLKSKQNFLDIIPDSFMCDVQLNGYPESNKTDLTHDYGDDIVLRCDIYADPEPLIYWMYGNKRLEKSLNDDFSFKYQINENYNYKGIRTNKTSELHIKNLQYNDIGIYTCIGEISGTTNRKQIQFNLKNLLKQTQSILQNKFINGLTLLILLISIAIIIFIFMIIVIVYICIKCKRLKQKHEQENDEENGDNLVNNLFLNDEFDSKLPNCIRYAQKNNNNNNTTATNSNSDDKYTITDALLNNSSSTIVQPLGSQIYQHVQPIINHHHHHHHHQQQQQQQQRLQLLLEHSQPTYSSLPQQQQQQQPVQSMVESGCYYDDLRLPYDEVLFLPIDHQNQILQQQHQQHIDYTDAHSMLYGTIMPQQQQQHNKLLTPIYGTMNTKYNNNQQSNGYYSQLPLQNQQSMTLLSSSSSSTNAASRIRNSNLLINHSHQQQQQAPIPPHLMLPPMKPKRTFEHSQSLLDSQNQITKNINGEIIIIDNNNDCCNHSSTTLDDEELDLNDLKDFEDVTFDNLRKPQERPTTTTNHHNHHQHQNQNLHRAKIVIDKNTENISDKKLLPKLIENHNLNLDNKVYEETEI